MKLLINKEKIYHIEVRVGHNLKYWRKNKIRNKSYYIDTKKGGGVIYELIHELNLIRYIFGNILKIKTIKSNYTLKKSEDHAISIFKKSNFCFHISWAGKKRTGTRFFNFFDLERNLSKVWIGVKLPKI